MAGRPRVLGFYVALTGAILLLAVPMAPFLIIPAAWPFLGEQLGIHQFHDIGVASVLWLVLMGLVVQYREPARHVAAMQQALVVILVLLAATAVARPGTLINPLLLPFALAIVAAAMHPSRREIGQLRRDLDLPLFAVAALAAGPAFIYVRGQLRLDSSLLPLAAHGGHWTSMATLAAAVIVLAFLSATRPRGWPVLIWSAGSAAFLFGLASFFLPHQASSVGQGWSVLAMAWAMAFALTGIVRWRVP